MEFATEIYVLGVLQSAQVDMVNKGFYKVLLVIKDSGRAIKDYEKKRIF